MWFEILKQDGITHFHGTKNKGAAEKIMKEGIKPALGFEGYRKADRYYVARHPPVISEVEYQQQEEFEILPELNGAYVWAAKEAPLGYSGWYEKTHADDRNVVFTDKGPIIQGKPDLYEWQEGGLWGIKGKDIEWHGKDPRNPNRSGDGWYTRNLGGNRHTKIMIGKPKV